MSSHAAATRSGIGSFNETSSCTRQIRMKAVCRARGPGPTLIFMAFFSYPAAQSGPGWGFLDSASESQYSRFKAHCEIKRFADGERIVQAGDLDRSLWVVLGGDLEVALPGKTNTVGAGTVFGEVAFFDAAPRSADVTARGSVELLVLTYDAFERLAAAEPELARTLLMDLGRFLAQRLRAADAT